MTTVPREYLIVATLNDGVEPEYPNTDVPRTALYTQVLFGQELDRQLAEQLPGWWTTQGTEDNADLGIAIKDGLMTVQDIQWTRLTTWHKTGGRSVLVVRADFLGCPLSLVTTHRIGKKLAEHRPEFDRNLGAVFNTERDAGRIIICGMDANEANSVSLQEATKMTWLSAYPSSIDGFLMSTRVTAVQTVALAKQGEHAPVLSLVKVPLLNA